MELTIAQLARAVDKDPGYVRQHVFRGHLKTHKLGNTHYIDVVEAARWAFDRRLTFIAPSVPSESRVNPAKRAARITILTLLEQSGRLRNLFTLIRHRREDSLGPWAPPNNEHWSSKNLANKLRLFTFDGSLVRILQFVDQIKQDSILEDDHLQIQYSLDSMPRNYWAYRDQRTVIDASIQSPFSRHSASITEYWSLTDELSVRWEELQAVSQGEIRKNLGFPLDTHADRIGNLMIASAEDAISCDLRGGPDQTLRFFLETDAFTPGTYHSTVWSTFCGMEVMRRAFEVTTNQTTLNLPSTIDRYGYAVHRTADGQCVDWMDTNLIMEVRGSIELDSQPTFHIQKPKQGSSQTVALQGETALVHVRADEDAPEMDQEVRQRWLKSNYIQQEKKAKEEGNVVRFNPQDFKKAVAHLIWLMRSNSANRNEPIYLADPYFELLLDTGKPENADLAQALVDLFSNAHPSPLRILCTRRWDPNEKPWWDTYPSQFTNHVCVRTFNKDNPQDVSRPFRAFHDRYLITRDAEFAITNSINGWLKQGTTFMRLSTGVYRAEAENLWSMSLKSNREPWFVQEVS